MVKRKGKIEVVIQHFSQGCVAQSVTCLAADMCLNLDPGVKSWILVRFHTFLKIDHEIISTVSLFSSADSIRVVVSYKQKYVHESTD